MKCQRMVDCLLASALALVAFGLCSRASADPIPATFDKRVVGFVFENLTNGTPRPLGTCFFVNVPVSTNMFACYLVTAKHVLQTSGGAQYRDQVLVRFSRDGGGTEFVVFPLQLTNSVIRPYTHGNPGVDIAVVPISENIVRSQRLRMLPVNLLATKEHMQKFRIREGDDMFFLGLFTPFYGSKSNLPIYRFGRLSMVPDEPVPFGNEPPQELYFMETQVFGGNSGSPALFCFSQERNPGDTAALVAGVIKGYYVDVSPLAVIEASAQAVSRQNTGIAVVTPAYLLKEILLSEELRKSRGDK